MKRLLFPIIILIIFLLFPLLSCKKEAGFDSLLICEEINEETLEAVKTKDVFDIDTEEIFAVVKYSHAAQKDSYFFVWTNINTGVKTTTEQYFLSNKKSLESGNLVSVLKLKEESLFITPGRYKVEFIYNNKLKSTAFFEINRPELEIISLELAGRLNKDGSPAEITREFGQTDTLFLSMKVNYMLKDNSFKVRWFDNKNKILEEDAYAINKDDLKNQYIAFTLKSGKGLFQDGDYEVDIYLNDKLVKTLPFKIVKTKLNLSSFSKNSEYSNKDREFSFNIPDNWNYLEFENEGQFQVQIVPPLSNMEIGFLFMVASDTKDFSEENLSKLPDKILTSFISEKELTEKEVRTGSGTIKDEIEYSEIKKIYVDRENNEWLLPFCFIVHENNLYIFYGIINGTMFSREVSDEIFYGIINSISFK
ncbi:MAG TPA: hypothetical protein GXZ93_01815 [Actinobacteria bacterium]|nr:hypothetical protein [Actinomycetota bacterium]